METFDSVSNTNVGARGGTKSCTFHFENCHHTAKTAHTTVDLRSRYTMNLRPTRFVSDKASECRWRPRRYRMDLWPRGRELASCALNFCSEPMIQLLIGINQTRASPVKKEEYCIMGRYWWSMLLVRRVVGMRWWFDPKDVRVQQQRYSYSYTFLYYYHMNVLVPVSYIYHVPGTNCAVVVAQVLFLGRVCRNGYIADSESIVCRKMMKGL